MNDIDVKQDVRNENPYKLYSQVYNQFYSEHIDTDFLNRVWSSSWQSILEVGVGQGRLIPFFTQHSIKQFVGLDISEDMIAKIPADYLADARVTCEASDFLQYATNQKFDLILYAYNTFNYMLTLDQAYQQLKQCCNYLTDDGMIFFDLTFPVCLRQGIGTISRAESVSGAQKYLLTTKHAYRIEDSQERRDFKCDIYDHGEYKESLEWQAYRRYYTIEDMIQLGRMLALSPVHLEMYLAKEEAYYDGYFLFLKRNAF